jgi:hypothetical protein
MTYLAHLTATLKAVKGKSGLEEAVVWPLAPTLHPLVGNEEYATEISLAGLPSHCDPMRLYSSLSGRTSPRCRSISRRELASHWSRGKMPSGDDHVHAGR